MKRFALTLFSLVTLAPGLVAQPLCELPEIEPPAVADEDELAALLAGYAEEAEALARAIPETSRELFAVLTETDLTPEGLNTWVADNTALIPYRGVLRGADGIIADRHGNSLDRSLLLAELVGLAGYDVRLAHAELDSAQLSTLTEQLASAPAIDPLPELDMAEAPPEVLALMSGTPTPEEQACQKAVQARLDEQVTALTSVLEDARVAMRATDIEPSLADHWWVQYFDGADWLDLDPAAVNAVANETLMVAELPGDMLHRVSLELGVDVVDSSGHTQTSVLSYESPARDLLTTSLYLSFQPLGLDSEALADSDDDEIAAALVEHKEWLALLRVDNNYQTGMMVTLDGIVQDPASGDATMQLGTGVGSAVDTFLGGALDALEDPENAAEVLEPEAAQLNAAYLRITLSSPGQESFVAERKLFDLDLQPESLDAGAEATRQRMAGLMTSYDILVNPAAAGGGARLARVAEDMAEYFRSLEAVASASDDMGGEELSQLAERLPRIPMSLESLAVLRLGTDGAAAAPVAANVILQRQSLGFGSAPDSLQIDIVSNAVAGAHDSGTAYARRLQQGVRDTIFEDLVLGDESLPSANTSRMFAEDLAASRPWRLLSRSEAGNQPVGVQASMEAGFLVIAPAAAGGEPYAYWRIDPTTGTTLGIGPSGAGQGAAEYLNLLNSIASTTVCVLSARTAFNAAACAVGVVGAAGNLRVITVMAEGGSAAGALWLGRLLSTATWMIGAAGVMAAD